MRLVSWYGDDFTGSTDVLEALAPSMSAVLFVRRPSSAVFARFEGCAAFGLAGSSRGESPAWMDTHLPAAFEWLKGLGAAVCHYKVCSTFDSSPETGNIGRAIETGRRVFGAACVPIVAGAPSLGRYTFFGHLFARSGDEVHRIDRHPAMSTHPVTPMRESDLRLHLAAQTPLRVGLFNAQQNETGADYGDVAQENDAVLIDVASGRALPDVGRLLWSARPPFVVGSSGVEYALLAHWNMPAAPTTAPGPADRVIALSGSCSPASLAQVRHARGAGFAPIRLDARALANGDDGAGYAKAALAAAATHRGVVMYTASERADQLDLDAEGRRRVGERSARILRRVVEESGARRVVVAGGDTSSHAGRALGIDALTFAARMAPGAPLCRAWSEDGREFEIVFKGGQCGGDGFLASALQGGD